MLRPSGYAYHPKSPGYCVVAKSPTKKAKTSVPATPVARTLQADVQDLRDLAPTSRPGEPADRPKTALPATIEALSLSRILLLLRATTGHDFSHYKKSTIGRRIERRMAQHKLADPDTYVSYLERNPAEVLALFKELLINVTSFFRDSEAFLLLRQDILPQLLLGKPEGYVFRVWVAGCSTGEETYSLAILLREYLAETRQLCKAQIYSTDIDDDAIAVARAGRYPLHITRDISPARLERFFTKTESGFTVKRELRDMVVFAIQNVIKDPPFTKLDLLSCRNLLIYLDPELQSRLIPGFHYALKPGGVLWLSPAESIGNHSELLVPLSRRWKFYQAAPSAALPSEVRASGLSWDLENGKVAVIMNKTKEPSCVELAKRILLQFYAPASVLTDFSGNIRYVLHSETSKYLTLIPGQATLSVVEMVPAGLQAELRTAIHNATSHDAPLNRAQRITTRVGLQTVSFSVSRLLDPDSGEGLLLLSFQDGPREGLGNSPGRRRISRSAESRRIEELQRELAGTKENLAITVEEQQVSNEALKSTNEELESTNEELQSVNEELVTVNAELHTKIQQLAGTKNDLKNCFDNIHIGTLFIDQDLIIRRFTPEAARLYHLAPTDVGRPLGDIKSNLKGTDLLAEIHVVLGSLVPLEREVRTISSVAHYLARIQPYRTVDGVVNGVVLTFTNIDERCAAEAKETQELAQSIASTVREPLLVLDGTLRVVCASSAFYRNFLVTAEQTIGRPIYELGNRQWDIAALRQLLETILPRDGHFDDYQVEHCFPTIGKRKMLLNAQRLAGGVSGIQLILLAIADVSI